jgi:hypothetical protein
MEYQRHGGLSDREFSVVIERLKTWASTHRRQSEPIILLMGQAMTPHEFVRQVEEQTEFGLSFLDYVCRQTEAARANGQDVEPKDFIDRAILANR